MLGWFSFGCLVFGGGTDVMVGNVIVGFGWVFVCLVSWY